MKKTGCFLLAGLLLAFLAGCGSAPASDTVAPSVAASSGQEAASPESGAAASDSSLSPADSAAGEAAASEESEEDTTMQQNTLYLHIGEKTFSATFADTSGARALQELLADGDLTISMSDYGGFEKVGSLGQSLPTENSQTTTRAGDIVLYQGNQIVIFYGSNSWSYTRLGKVDDLTGWEETLGNDDISVTFSLTGE